MWAIPHNKLRINLGINALICERPHVQHAASNTGSSHIIAPILALLQASAALQPEEIILSKVPNFCLYPVPNQISTHRAQRSLAIRPMTKRFLELLSHTGCQRDHQTDLGVHDGTPKMVAIGFLEKDDRSRVPS